MPDNITPVGAMIQPPNPQAGMNSLSSILGVAQQGQNLQRGAYGVQEAQAGAEQAQQANAEKQALATFTRNAVHDPTYHNADGSLNVTKFQTDASSVAPVYGQAYIGQATANANGAVESRKSLLALNKDQLDTAGNYFGAVAAKPGATTEDLIDAAELARGVSDDRQYQRHIDRMLATAPKVGNLPSEEASTAIRQHARTIALGTGAASAAQSNPNMAGVNTLGGVQQVQTNPQSPLGIGKQGAPVAGSSLPAIAGATSRQTGTGSADIDTSNIVVAAQRNARANIDLTKRIDQLADVVSPGRLPAEVSSGLGALGLQNVNQARSELIKDLGRLQTNYTERAGSDERARTILSGLPNDTTPTQTIHQAMDVTRGSAKQDLALGALREKNAKATNGQMNGFQGDYAHAVSAASPLMHEYLSLTPQEQVGFFKRNFQTKAQAQAFRAQAESVKKMSPDAVSQ